MKSKWTAEEDRILTEAVKRFGEKNWQQVANCLHGRTGQQVSQLFIQVSVYFWFDAHMSYNIQITYYIKNFVK